MGREEKLCGRRRGEGRVYIEKYCAPRLADKKHGLSFVEINRCPLRYCPGDHVGGVSYECCKWSSPRQTLPSLRGVRKPAYLPSKVSVGVHAAGGWLDE